MNAKKIVLYGLLAGVINSILGLLISNIFMIFPQVSADYKSAGVMRPLADPLMLLFFVYPFIDGIILAWVWSKAKSLFSGSVSARGIKFGLAIFLISTVPGMFMSYTCFPLSVLTIISWTASGLVTAIAAGMIFAKVNR